jgi:hypothetical protein
MSCIGTRQVKAQWQGPQKRSSLLFEYVSEGDFLETAGS